MGDFEQVIFGRRSIRKYLDEHIPNKIIYQILEAAIYAPTASNIQPWIFGIINDSKLIKNIEAFSPGMPRGASVIIAVCSDQKLAESKGGNRNLCTLDCAMAGENLQLAAYDKGIGGCVLCSFNRPAVSAILKIPDHVYLEYLITLGYKAQEPKAPKRKPVENVSFINHWSDEI